jgi:hypothetical protein
MHSIVFFILFCVPQFLLSVCERKRKELPHSFSGAHHVRVFTSNVTTGDVDRRGNLTFVFDRWTMSTDALLPETEEMTCVVIIGAG